MKAAHVFLLLFLAAQSFASGNSTEKRAAELDIHEAVIRFQIKTWDLEASSYCVSINGKTPSKELLKRLNPLPVKIASGCRKKTIAGVQMSVLDKQTGKRSVIFDVGSIRWLKGGEAEVDGGYVCGSLCMAAGTYHVIRDQTGWTVTKFAKQVVS